MSWLESDAVSERRVNSCQVASVHARLFNPPGCDGSGTGPRHLLLHDFLVDERLVTKPQGCPPVDQPFAGSFNHRFGAGLAALVAAILARRERRLR